MLAAWLMVLLSGVAAAGETGHYSPHVARDFPRNLYWGDTHVHSNRSMDAFSTGNVSVSPGDAYRFARGETVQSASGQRMRLGRPLDFVVLADHAEWLGLFPLLASGDERALATGPGRRWGDWLQQGESMQALMDTMQVMFAPDVPAGASALDLHQDRELLGDLWREGTATADRFNDPGRFTAFIGYEWTAMPGGNNLHRNVIFRDGAERADQVLPFSTLDSQDVEDLWRHLDEYERSTGGQVLAIPHNANGSNGLMFAGSDATGQAMSRDYATTRARWEPLIEVTQIKGDAEAHPLLSPDDRFADFETWDDHNYARQPKEERMLRHEYARGALKLGLELEQQIGVNPYRFGMLGSSDTHTSLAAVAEDNFAGKFTLSEPAPDRVTKGFDSSSPSIIYAASGYMGIWAQDNTRESLFDAMRRREVYATTGPRIHLRLFGGWDFAADDHLRPDCAAVGYAGGVPMGGEMAPARGDSAPRFLICAAKDPVGANLERVQVVKAWLDGNGEARERVYDVAVSDGRQPAGDGSMLQPLASTVDVKSGRYMNSVGAAQLAAVWQDPDFDRAQQALYYARVLEIATPRWTTIEAAFYGRDAPAGVPAEIRERAYSSPIWYTPEGAEHEQ